MQSILLALGEGSSLCRFGTCAPLPLLGEIQITLKTLLLKEQTSCFSEVEGPPTNQRNILTPDQGLSVWAGSPGREVKGYTF